MALGYISAENFGITFPGDYKNDLKTILKYNEKNWVIYSCDNSIFN